MRTLLHFFDQSVDKFHDNIYLWENRGDGYRGTTFGQTREDVYCLAAGLMSLGIKKGDRIALLSEARNLWVVCEFGILFAGAVNVPLSVRMNEPDELIFRLNHSGSSILFVSGSQANKIRQIRNKLPLLEKIIILDDIPPASGDGLPVASVMNSGKRFLADHRDAFDKIVASVTPDDYANISYTSGTTADPKGIILTHRNYVANIEQGYSLMDIDEKCTTLLILPWDHAFAHTAGIFCFMGKGASVASVQPGGTQLETLKNISKNISEIRPCLLFTVPAIAKLLKRNIERSVRVNGKLAALLFAFSVKIASTCYNSGWDRGKAWRSLLKPLVLLSDLMFFRKIRNGFGGRLEFIIGGGALLDIEFQHFFYAIGIPMLQGYGLTEASPFISSNSMHQHKLGSSGRVVADLDLRICDDRGKQLPPGETGEIVVKGENVMAGYWMNDQATRETLKDGWLHTGDIGYMDSDGFLYVLGRVKSLLIADDGEKYSPEGMEEAFSSQSGFIEQCMLYNNQDPYTVVLVVPGKEALLGFLHGKGFAPGSIEGHKAALEKLAGELREYRTGNRYGSMFPQRWLPSAVAVLEEPFTEENGLLNFQLKIVRTKVTAKYSRKLAYLYTPPGKDIFNEQNLQALHALLTGNNQKQSL